MNQKKLSKTIKSTIIAVAALGFGTVIGSVSLGSVVTTYAQEYTTFSRTYHLKQEQNQWNVYNWRFKRVKDYDGLVSNKYGWWKCNNGSVDFSYTGLAQNEYGWWYVENGGINFSYENIVNNAYGWWKVIGGQVDFTYNGVAPNEYGWWKVTDGKVDFDYNGLASNEYGWWKITNGGVDFGYTGLERNEAGLWYVENGKITFTYNGTIQIDGQTYEIEDSKVKEAAPEPEIEQPQDSMMQLSSEKTSEYYDFYEEVLYRVNEIRDEVGVGYLVLDETMCEAATYRSLEMNFNNVFSHTRPDGTSCFTIFDYYQIQDSRTKGENIAAGYRSPEEVVEGWKNSPGHYANMINANFTRLGVGLSKEVEGDMYGWYWTQLFSD